MKLRAALGRGGVAGAACVACCAPPLIGALGLTVGLAATAGILLGIAGVVTVLLVAAGVVAARRTRRTSPPPTHDEADPVSVGAPTVRPRPPSAGAS